MILLPFVNVGRKRHENMFRSIQDIVSGDDPHVENGKPAPDIYLEAAKRLGMHPSECLVFEDALTGAEAGKSAGCHVVAVPDSRMEREPLVDVADEIIDDMWQFSGKRWGIPLEMRELRRQGCDFFPFIRTP
jgi:beta-phosphoglucomutase-like phosphatase (HAD superfamily)